MAATVVVLIAAPEGLRGHLTRWYCEIAPGVFVGTTNRRIRDRLWPTIAGRIGDGHAVMVEPAPNEQGWSVRTAGRERWLPIEMDGLILISRPRKQKP